VTASGSPHSVHTSLGGAGDVGELLTGLAHEVEAGDHVLGGDDVVAPALAGDGVEKILPGGESIVVHLHVVDGVVHHLDKA